MLLFQSMMPSAISRQLLPAALTIAFSLVCISCSGGGANGDDPLEPPASPTGLEASSQNGSIALEWAEATGADAYRIYRSTTPGLTASGSPLETGLSSPNHVDESAANGTTYYYVVTAMTSEGEETAESTPSDEVEATPFSDPPDRP